MISCRIPDRDLMKVGRPFSKDGWYFFQIKSFHLTLLSEPGLQNHLNSMNLPFHNSDSIPKSPQSLITLTTAHENQS
jgi:hypothetical protein